MENSTTELWFGKDTDTWSVLEKVLGADSAGNKELLAVSDG